MTPVVSFKSLRREDFPLLSIWFATPHCGRWWNDDPSPASIENDYGPCADGAEPCEVFIAHCDGRPVGMVQRFRMGAYPKYIDQQAHIVRAPAEFSSIDYLIGPADALGRGIGTAMVTALVASIWKDDPETPGIIVPVHADNRRSWRTLERAGFVRVAEGELEPDNPIDSPAHLIYQLMRPA